MRRRDFMGAFASIALAGCAAAPRELPVSPDFVVENVAERALDALPPTPMFWRIENFPAIAEAQEAAGPASLAAKVSGRVWLVTLGAAGARTPGAATSVHTHPGSEAFFVLKGQLSQITPHGVARVNAGETLNGHMPGMAMQLQSTGAENLDQLVLFVVDARQPFSSPASFER